MLAAAGTAAKAQRRPPPRQRAKSQQSGKQSGPLAIQDHPAGQQQQQVRGAHGKTGSAAVSVLDPPSSATAAGAGGEAVLHNKGVPALEPSAAGADAPAPLQQKHKQQHSKHKPRARAAATAGPRKSVTRSRAQRTMSAAVAAVAPVPGLAQHKLQAACDADDAAVSDMRATVDQRLRQQQGAAALADATLAALGLPQQQLPEQQQGAVHQQLHGAAQGQHQQAAVATAATAAQQRSPIAADAAAPHIAPVAAVTAAAASAPPSAAAVDALLSPVQDTQQHQLQGAELLLLQGSQSQQQQQPDQHQLCDVVQGFEHQLEHLQDEVSKQQQVQEAAGIQHTNSTAGAAPEPMGAAATHTTLPATGAAQGQTAAAAHSTLQATGAALDPTAAAIPSTLQVTQLSPAAATVLLEHQAAQDAAAEAEAAAAAAALAAAALEHQQRIEHAPQHKRAFEALVAAAAVEAEAAASEDSSAGKPPSGKRQRRGKTRMAAAAAAAAAGGGHGNQLGVDAYAYIAVPGQHGADAGARTAAAAEEYPQVKDAAAVPMVGRLAEAVAAALAAAAAAGQAGATDQHSSEGGVYEQGTGQNPSGMSGGQEGAGFSAEAGGFYGWEGAWSGSWDGGVEGMQQEGGVMQQQGRGDPHRAEKKRLAASESYKRKKEQEVQLNAYWLGLQVRGVGLV